MSRPLIDEDDDLGHALAGVCILLPLYMLGRSAGPIWHWLSSHLPALAALALGLLAATIFEIGGRHDGIRVPMRIVGLCVLALAALLVRP